MVINLKEINAGVLIINDVRVIKIRGQEMDQLGEYILMSMLERISEEELGCQIFKDFI